MKIWTCRDHTTHFPVGGASIVVAETEDEAQKLLCQALYDRGLDPAQPFTLKLLDTSTPHACVLRDGDY